jgi:hypothetical protein
MVNLWKRIFGKKTISRDYVAKNQWGIRAGMSVENVHNLLVQNGFEEDIVKLPSKFGPDPSGYMYPCWKNKHTKKGITSSFKDGKLLELRISQFQSMR